VAQVEIEPSSLRSGLSAAMDEHFARSPFALTATSESAKIWCARPDSLKHVKRIIGSIKTRSESSLDLIWANFGAGKSHALYFIENELRRDPPQAATAFVELSEGIRTFRELYALIVASADLGQLLGLADAQISGIDEDFRRIVSVYKHGDDTARTVARRWLLAEKVDLRELKRFANVSGRVDSDGKALDVLTSVVRSLGSKKFVILIDEFQRISAIPERYRAPLLACVRTLFNKNPCGLNLIVAVTSALQQTVMNILPAELRTILGPKPALSLPELSQSEGLEFCHQRLAAYRPVGYSRAPLYPFGDGVVVEALRFIDEQSDVRLTPRNIIHILGYLYEELDSRQFSVLTTKEAKEVLARLNWDVLR
jgi:hypothetical protein